MKLAIRRRFLRLVMAVFIMLTALTFSPVSAFADEDGGRSYVVMRGLFEALGFVVGWESDGDTHQVILTNEDYTIVFTIGSYAFIVNGEMLELNFPVKLADGRAVMPACAPLLFGSSIPLDTAFLIFDNYNAIIERDGGKLWGQSLWAPIILADPVTRHAISNMADPEGFFAQIGGGLYFGVLPIGVHIGATVVNFNGVRWGMGPWRPHLLRPNMDMIASHSATFVHEGFHAIQYRFVPEILMEGIAAPSSDFMVNADARITALLEIYALIAAFDSVGNEKIEHIHNALSFRAHRRYLFPEAIGETFQEILEGLASYTDLIALDCITQLVDFYALVIFQRQNTQALNPAIGYFTGMAYALLLDIFEVDWQQNLTFRTDMAAILKNALGIDELTPFDEIDKEQYGYAEIAPAQRAFEEDFNARYGPFIDILLNQPTFALPAEFLDLRQVPGATDLFIFAGFRMMRGEFGNSTGIWQLDVSNGFVKHEGLGNRRFNVHLPACPYIEVNEDGTLAVSPVWTLKILDDGYRIQAIENGVEIVPR